MTRPVRKRSAVQRTVVMPTERLDHHRNRGQQQITVKHVTVNADQAIVGNVKHHPGRSELQAKGTTPCNYPRVTDPGK